MNSAVTNSAVNKSAVKNTAGGGELLMRRQYSRSTSEEMQLINISVDKLACQNYGQCVLEAPNIFSLNSDDELEYLAEADDDERDNVEAAVDVCPMQAIRIVE